MTNTLYYGDNLDILRRYVKDETVDLVYLDPPFNSNANYNVLFAEQDGPSWAQVKAFEDTWEWNQESAKAYQDVVEAGGNVSQTMQGFRMMLGDANMLAYLSMMAKSYPRLQILTISELLSGRGIDMPPLKQVAATFKKAPKAKNEEGQTLSMPLDGSD